MVREIQKRELPAEFNSLGVSRSSCRFWRWKRSKIVTDSIHTDSCAPTVQKLTALLVLLDADIPARVGGENSAIGQILFLGARAKVEPHIVEGFVIGMVNLDIIISDIEDHARHLALCPSAINLDRYDGIVALDILAPIREPIEVGEPPKILFEHEGVLAVCERDFPAPVPVDDKNIFDDRRASRCLCAGHAQRGIVVLARAARAMSGWFWFRLFLRLGPLLKQVAHRLTSVSAAGPHSFSPSILPQNMEVA